MLFIAAYGQETTTGNYRNSDLPKQERQLKAQDFHNQQQTQPVPVPAKRTASPVVDMNVPQKAAARAGAQPHPAVRSNNAVDYNKAQVPPNRNNTPTPRSTSEVKPVDYSKAQEVKKRTGQ